MKWPAVSPDVNPMENLWANVTHGLNNIDNQATNLQQLHQAIFYLWQNIHIQRPATLVESISRCLTALCNAHSGYTKY